jgi:hypothetical protein
MREHLDDTALVTVADRETGRRLNGWVREVGDDVVVAIGGGERPHVGCAVLATPYAAKTGPPAWSASCSVLTIPPHKEEPIARGIATRLASGLGRIVVVTAGVHDDNIDPAGIRVYLELGEELAEALVARLTPIECSQR